MKHPNIIFLFSDQHRKSSMGFWSNPQYRDCLLGEGDPVHTPHLDRLAEEGIVVSNAYSSYPVSSPFRAMLFSGRYPANNGVWQNCAPGRRDELRGDIDTFTDILSDSGYSVGYVGKWHLEHPEANFDGEGNYIADDPSYRGERYFPDGSPDSNTVCWDTLIPRDRQRKIDYLYAYNTWDIFRAEPDMPAQKRPHYWDKNQNRITAPDGVWSPDFETDLAIDFLKNENGERKAENPFALFVSYNPPHSPYTSRSDTDFEAYDRYYSQKAVPDAKELLKRKNVTLEDKKFLEQTRVYFSHVTGIDRCVGRILDSLTPEQAENTLVVFTADHGEMLGSHGLMAKNVPYEEATAIPFLIRYPGKLTHRCDPLLLTGPDILPTVLTLAGISIPEGIEGHDYASLLITGRGERPRTALFTQVKKKGVRSEKYLLTVTYESDRAYGDVRIYDLENDPYQMLPLRADDIDPQQLLFLRAELGKHLKHSSDPWYQKRLYADFILYPED